MKTKLSPYSVPTLHTSVKMIIFTSFLAILTPEAILHDTANYMSASSLTVIGYQTTQQKIFLADSNMVNKHETETYEQPNRWHWRPNPPHCLRSTMEVLNIAKPIPPIPPHCLRSTMWKDLPKVTKTMFSIKEETKKQSPVYKEKNLAREDTRLPFPLKELVVSK